MNAFVGFINHSAITTWDMSNSTIKTREISRIVFGYCDRLSDLNMHSKIE